MTIKKILLTLAGQLACWLILFFYSTSVFAVSEPAFWKVSKGGATVYLFGSMHFGRTDFYPLPPEIDRAYEASSKLVVEVDIAKVTPDKATSAIYQHGRLPLGQTLSTLLSPKVYANLTQRAQQAQLPLAAFGRFQPWFVAVQLVEAEIRKTQLQQQLGLDLYFINKAQKPVVELETLEQQLGLFGNLSMSEQEAFLAQTLIDMDASQSYLMAMADAWQRGDSQQMEEIMINPFKERADTKKLFQKIFVERNNRMTAAVNQFLAEPHSVFFVVGLGHMIGDEGIVAQLTRQGLTVERIKFNSIHNAKNK